MALCFAGKHAAVVGATGVIGSHIAQAFSRQGAVVSLLGRSALSQRSRLEGMLSPPAAAAAGTTAQDSQQPSSQTSSLARSNAASIPTAHQFLKLDVSDAANVKEVFAGRRGDAVDGEGEEQQAAVVGPVDFVVNCAGISQTTFLKRTPDEELEKIVNTNLLATMLVCKYAKVQSHGCIINVSSLMAIHGGFGATAYAASKAGLIGFTRALCRELAPRSIRVNALLPGWVDSDMWQALKPELQQAYLKDTPLGRVADPAEVADAAMFLAANQFANNCVLNLDGGLSAA